MSRQLIDATDCVKDLQHIRGADKNAFWKMACDYLINKIDAMPTIEVPTWIPVTERLPKASQSVFVTYLFDGRARVDIDNYIDGLRWLKHRNVTHWMPLPEAPTN